jgi:hypothetical protein
VSLRDNPIFLTQKRLVHRGGVLAAILIAALIGLSLFSGLVAYLANPRDFDFQSAQDAGEMFYGWTIGVEILVLAFGAFSRISQTLANERKAGLWDSNRLTPLKPQQIIIGYWFGAPLREVYMGAVLGGIGLIIVLLSRLPFTLWLGTQVLAASTALFLGLLGLLMGMAFSRPQGILIVLAVFFLYPFSLIAPHYMLTNFLFPIYGIANLFINANPGNNPPREWSEDPQMFGLAMPAIIVSLILQLIIGIFLWRAAKRKTSDPFRAPLLRWEAVALFGIFVFAQHGLLWGLWHGSFPSPAPPHDEFYERDSMLPIVNVSTVLVGVVILAFAGLKPEHVRVEAMRSGLKNTMEIFRRSSVFLALILAAVGIAGMCTQSIFSFSDSWKIEAVVAGNLLDCLLIFSLLLEFCRLRFKRRALGFAALWLFVICLLPYILAGVFTTSAFAWASLLSPGVVALGQPGNEELTCLFWIIAAHFGVVVLLFLMWRREWLKLLAKASADQK